MVSVTNRFPLWGDVGEEPQDGFLYEGGDQVNKKHLNYLWDKIQKQTDDFITKTDDLQAQIDVIDSDGDGVVNEADNALRYDGLSPTDGTAGQRLETNGTTVSWADSFSLSVSEDNTVTVQKPTNINFVNGISVTDDGDDTVTVNADEVALAYNFVTN